MNTNLQAAAVYLTLHKPITLLYLLYHLMALDLDDILGQLKSPCVLMGDLNSHYGESAITTLKARL